MARATPKKKASATASGSGTILSFFHKAADKSPIANNGTVKVERDEAIASTTPRTHGKAKGEGKAVAEVGSVADPVVISDDDEPVLVSSTVKRRRTSVDRPASSPAQFDLDQTIFPAAEHSRSSPPRTASVEDRNPFPAFPGFEKPPTWPEIINTASGTEDNDDVLNLDEDGDGSVIMQDSDDEDEETGAISFDAIEDDTREPMPSPIAPTKPVEQTSPLASTSRHPLLDGEDDFDTGLIWDEPEDEGMGMEEEGDEEASEIIATPPPVTMKRKRAGTGEKVDECPVCGKSLKGKPNTITSQHINSCLDASASGSAFSRKTIRPITSISHTYSPAGSPSPPPEETSKGPNAFSVLMSGHKEKEQWKDAEIDLKRDGKRHFGRRKAPFYKVMTGMPVAVDAFRYGAIPKVKAYLLTHAHSDHYTNLSKAWKEGPIYCSETTANLIVHMLGVEPQWVHGLPDNIPFEMPGTGGVKVTPIEANHCPGSSIFLFEGPQTVNAGDSSFKSPYVGSKRIFRYLHCGDFRACPKMVLHPDIARAKIDTCYLDTTYLNPKYCFPPQPQVIEACAILARKVAMGVSEKAPKLEELKPEAKVDLRFDAKPDVNAVKEELEEKERGIMRGWLVSRESGDEVKLEDEEEVKLEDTDSVKVENGEGDALKSLNDLMVPKPVIKVKPKARTLIVMGTYSIGKERIVKAVAKALGTKIYCDPRKRGILLCQTDPELHALLSTDPVESQVHLLPLGNIQLDALQPYLARLHPHFDRVLGFRPTGWSYSPPAGTDMLPDVNMVIRRDQSRTFGDASLKPMRGSCRQFMMYGVPYSEHSSFFELTCFALSVPGPDVKMIATVNVGNEKSRAKMKKWFEKWQAEKLKRKDKGLPAIVDYRDETYDFLPNPDQAYPPGAPADTQW